VTHRVAELAEYPESFPARVRVRLRCGAVHEVYVAHNVGSPGNPMDASQIGAKFLACVEPAVGNAAAAGLQQAFRSLPEASTTEVLLSALARATVAEAAWN
jgi:2-methylcitrate dehydratase PrpD